MAGAVIGGGRLGYGDACANVAPMVRCDPLGPQPLGFDGVDDHQGGLNLHPGLQVQQDSSAGGDEGHGIEGFARGNRSQDPEP